MRRGIRPGALYKKEQIDRIERSFSAESITQDNTMEVAEKEIDAKMKRISEIEEELTKER